MSLPQRLLSHQLAFRTISDSDEEDTDCGGRPLQPWQATRKRHDYLNVVFDTIDDEQSQLLVS